MIWHLGYWLDRLSARRRGRCGSCWCWSRNDGSWGFCHSDPRQAHMEDEGQLRDTYGCRFWRRKK